MNRRRPTARRTARRAGGALLLITVPAVLAALGGLLWWLQVELPAGRRATDRAGLDRAVRNTADALHRAAADGTLTTTEITAVDRPADWTISRGPTAIRIARTFTDTEATYTCWSFTLAVPLGPDTAVRTGKEHDGRCAERG
ncbi:hypothetical protein [Streptomyces sp. NBC_00648]|uniref:hypothetical protein n=1 Tax=Streptomyces sp. NBC_00648 TaxID=2975797 RepID=UPI003243E606